MRRPRGDGRLAAGSNAGVSDSVSHSDRALVSRLGAAVVALIWAFIFFGIIDFLVAVIPPEFPDFNWSVVLETSWGLLYMFLLPLPLIAWAVRPVGWVGPQVAV